MKKTAFNPKFTFDFPGFIPFFINRNHPMHFEDIPNHRYRALMILGIILPFLLVPALEIAFLEKGQALGYRFLLSRLIIWAALGAMFLYAWYAEVQKFFLWPEDNYGFGFIVQWVILLYLLCFAAQIIAIIPQQLGFRENTDILLKTQLIFKKHQVLGVFTAITAGITEEFFFRGYIMSRLAMFFKNKHHQVLISAGLFSAIHIGYHNLSEIIFSFSLGLIFGYHYQRYRNIMVVAIVHFIVDMVAVLIAIHRK